MNNEACALAAKRIKAMHKALRGIDNINGSTGGNAALVAEFKHLVRIALAGGA